MGAENVDEILLDTDMKLYLVRGSTTFGATNPVGIVLVSKGKVVGLGVRVADSLNRRHPDAGDDRVDPRYIGEWNQLGDRQ